MGGFAQAWPAKRLTLNADYLYIKVDPEDGEASVTDWRAGASFDFSRHVGIGAEYKHYGVQLRPRGRVERAGRGGHVRGLPGVRVVPLLARGEPASPRCLVSAQPRRWAFGLVPFAKWKWKP